MNKSRLFSSIKLFLVAFVIGTACGVILMFCVGCGDNVIMEADMSAPDAFVMDGAPEPSDLLPSKMDPVQACYDIISWLKDKSFECFGDETEAKEFAKVLLLVWDCPSMTGLKDGVELYTECHPTIQNMSCNSFHSGSIPISCIGQIW